MTMLTGDRPDGRCFLYSCSRRAITTNPDGRYVCGHHARLRAFCDLPVGAVFHLAQYRGMAATGLWRKTGVCKNPAYPNLDSNTERLVKHPDREGLFAPGDRDYRYMNANFGVVEVDTKGLYE